MPIRIIENTKSKVVADYIGKESSVANITIDGDFRNMAEAREAIAEYLLSKKIISAGQFLGFISSIRNPRSKEHYSQLGKKGMLSRWGKK